MPHLDFGQEQIQNLFFPTGKRFAASRSVSEESLSELDESAQPRGCKLFWRPVSLFIAGILQC